MANQDWRSDLRPPQFPDIHTIGRRSSCGSQNRDLFLLKKKARNPSKRTKTVTKRSGPYTPFPPRPGGPQFKSQLRSGSILHINLSVHMHPASTPVLAADKLQANHFFFRSRLLATFLSLKVPNPELQNCRLVLDSSPELKDKSKAAPSATQLQRKPCPIFKFLHLEHITQNGYPSQFSCQKVTCHHPKYI